MRPRSLAVAFPFLFLFLFYSSCGSGAAETPEIVRADQQGTDLLFRIARHERRADGAQILSAVATLQGRPVGFDLELGPWRENPPGLIDLTTWECSATLRSQGDASDALVSFLDELYGTRLEPASMVGELELRALSPWKNPGTFEDGGAKFLLLFSSGFEFDEAGELRIEVDLDDARLHVREKDERLRLAVMKPLCAAP